MRCPACNTDQADAALDCTACGLAMARPCPDCGERCAIQARFCSACGRSLQPHAGATAAPTWGQIKPATILFADIAGSTEQIAGLDPEQAMQQLQPAIERMVAVVEAHGGSVLRTLGDGVMALFGVPLALEHHAQQACHAALTLRALFSPEAGRIALRVGLHSGKVASDPTEAGDRRGGGAHGLSIHLASRVSAQAQPGQVLLTAATREAVHGTFATTATGRRHLKGIVDPVELFTLDHAVASAAPAPSQPGLPTRFVDRQAEMARLLQLLELARQSRGAVVGITAEAGAGKSRLCAEFAARCSHLGIPVHRVRAMAHGPVVPMAPMLDLLLQACFELDRTASPEQVRRAVASALTRVGQLDAVNIDLLHELFGLPDPGASPPRDALARPARLQAVMRALMRDPLAPCRVLVVEDLHWLDHASHAMLSVVAAAVADTRTLLVCNSRSSLPADWGPMAHATHMSLGALPSSHVRELLAAWCTSAPERQGRLPPEVLDDLVARCQGNPLFTEELARHVVQGGALDTLPDSIEAIVGARLDALDDTLKRVLFVGAIAGQRFEPGLLASVLEQTPDSLAPSLARLCALGILVAKGQPPVYDFVHPLQQEVAYASQLRSRRKQLHARVAAALERLPPPPARRAEHAWRLAHHHEQAEQRMQAARYAAEAASALTYVSGQEISQRWSKVLDLLEDEHDAQARPLRALAAGRVVYLGWRGGLSADAVDRLTARALDDARQIDPRLPQLLLFAQARLRQSSGGAADDFVAAIRRILAMPAPPGDAGRRATLNVVLSQALGWAGLLREALAANDEAMAGVQQVSTFDRDFIGFDVERWTLALRVRLLCRMGRLSEGRRCLDRLQYLGREEVDLVIRHMICTDALEIDIASGHLERTAGHMRELERLAMEGRGDYVQIANDYFRGVGAFVLKKHLQAKSSLQRGLLTLRVTKVAMDFEVDLLAATADVHWALRDFAAARRAALETLQVARQRNHRVGECRAALMLARLGSEREGVESPSWLEQADTLIRQTGAAYLQPALRAAQARARLSAPAAAAE